MTVSDSAASPSAGTSATDAKTVTGKQQQPAVAVDDPSATTGAQLQAAASAPSQQPSSDATSNGSALTSPSKRRGEEIEKYATAQAEAADDDSTQPAKRARPDDQPPKVLPIRYEFCPVEDMVELIAHMLNELIATNDAIRTTSGGLTRFHSRYVRPDTIQLQR